MSDQDTIREDMLKILQDQKKSYLAEGEVCTILSKIGQEISLAFSSDERYKNRGKLI